MESGGEDHNNKEPHSDVDKKNENNKKLRRDANHKKPNTDVEQRLLVCITSLYMTLYDIELD